MAASGACRAMEVRPLADHELEAVSACLPLSRYPGDGVYLVAWEGDAPIGHAFLAFGVELEVQDVFVPPELRRRGIATALMGAAEQEAVRRGYPRVRLTFDEDAVAPRRLYERLGYAPSGAPYRRTGTVTTRTETFEVDVVLVPLEKRVDDLRTEQARPEEAENLVRLHRESFETAFADLVERDVFSGDPVSERAARWRRSLERGEETLVARQGSNLVGLVVAKPSPDDRSLGEIRLLYVAPRVWRKGVGRALLASAEESLRGQGFVDAVLWVLERNTRARRFYEASGWLADAVSRTDAESGLREVRYRKRL